MNTVGPPSTLRYLVLTLDPRASGRQIANETLPGVNPRYRRLVIPCALALLIAIVVIRALLRG